MTPGWVELARRCQWLAYWRLRALRRSWREWRVSRRPAPREWWDAPVGAPIREECRTTFAPFNGGGGIDMATGKIYKPFDDGRDGIYVSHEPTYS